MICMSKTGDTLRNYCRMYPGLVNNTTIIWYLPWPEQALMEVANKYLSDIKLLKKVEIVLE
jgi:dynein heavy chain